MQKASQSNVAFPLARPNLGKLERKFLLDAFDSGWISSRGKFIAEFECNFSNYCSAKYAVSTSNGTTALHLALVALGIGKYDEVIVPDMSFIAPANAVTYTGAKCKFADSNKDYWGVDADSIKRRITHRTKAVIVVHLYGHPVDIDPIEELCQSRGIYLIEDCAEAHGAKYNGKRIGNFGRISCFSFFGNKLLTTGEGGMCLTNDAEIADKMRMLRDHGMEKGRHFWHPVVGFNYRMTNLQAAIGCAQLSTLEKRIKKYREIGHEYTRRLSRPGIVTHPEIQWAECVYWMYTLLIKGLSPSRRDLIQQNLFKAGIETRPMFYPISHQPFYKNSRLNNHVAVSLSRAGLSLPTFYDLTLDDVNLICDRLDTVLLNQSG